MKRQFAAAQRLAVLTGTPSPRLPDFRIRPRSDGLRRRIGRQGVASAKELSGSSREEYSWTSKTVHWLLPWRVPAFDEKVRDYLGVPKGWDLERAYGEVARRIFALAREEPPEPAWAGPLEPCTPLRALDKWLWWDGGGKGSPAYVDPDPWRGRARAWPGVRMTPITNLSEKMAHYP